MSSRYKLFLLELLPVYGRWLRRYTGSHSAAGGCPLMTGAYSYHDNEVRIEDAVPPPGWACGDSHPHDDPRWPTTCECGFIFRPQDEWQLFWNPLYKGPDGQIYTTHSNPKFMPAPPGAIWYMDDWPTWDKRKVIDGHSIMIMTPAGPWSPDEPSWDHGTPGPGWSRTGKVPDTLDVKPSIRIGDPTRYHGFVNNGWLEACGDSPT